MTVLSDNRGFLNRFPQAHKSYVANLFLLSVRRGARTPDAVMASVRQELRTCQERARYWHNGESESRYTEVAATLNEHPAEARAYAQWALEWERLTPAEKERERNQNGEAYRQAWMRQQPATAKQRSYLAALGYEGEITSKQHASELIDQLATAKRVSR